MAATVDERIRIETMLSNPSLAALNALLGPVIRVRLSAPDHNCNLIRLLAEGNHRILSLWETPCSLYLRAVRKQEDASQKFQSELVGFAKKRDPASFDAALGDFFAEIAVVAELFRKGLREFVPLVPVQARKGFRIKTPDYSCLVPLTPEEVAESTTPPTQDQTAYLEVKNLRAPIGITTAFGQELKQTPRLSRYGLSVEHHWDNAVTEEQRNEIRAFLTDLADSPIKQSQSLMLSGGVKVDVSVTDQAGEVRLTRPLGGHHSWGPFTERSKFLNKATEKIRDGIDQLSGFPNDCQILALNVQTPDGSFPTDYGSELQSIVERESEGRVHSLIFHEYHFVEPL